ncbi:hypothetical protein PABG_11654 [Paracoccidioides brasiliensis Pb03]|nr:hypothetical protein PABG_11654 [Paracoccidioides brasiliensis Pb03]
MKELNWASYNERKMQNFVNGLNTIHDTLVYDNDVHPRNTMTVEGDPERAIWRDFDRAQTFNGELTERQKEWIVFEKNLMAEMAEFMKHEFLKGDFDKTYQCYEKPKEGRPNRGGLVHLIALDGDPLQLRR